MPDVIIPIDLGKRQDYTARIDLYRSLRIDSVSGNIVRNSRGDDLYRYAIGKIQRYARGTDYTDIVKDVRKSLIEGDYPDPIYMPIDATGVGAGVFEMFLNAKLPKAIVVPITITAGQAPVIKPKPKSFARGAKGYWVPKSMLASHLQSLVQSQDIRSLRGVQHSDLLRKEMQNFQVKISKAGNDQFEARDGEHDDLVLALAMGVWFGSISRAKYLNNARIKATEQEIRQFGLDKKIEDELRKKDEEEEERKRDKEWRSWPPGDHWFN